MKKIDHLKNTAAEENSDVVAYIEQRAADPEQSRRYFTVGFRDSNVRAVFPDNDNPRRCVQQIVSKDGRIYVEDPDFVVNTPNASDRRWHTRRIY